MMSKSSEKDTGHDHYPRPEEPTTCCGRGCEGCVWISYFEALNRWEELSKAQEVKTV